MAPIGVNMIANCPDTVRPNPVEIAVDICGNNTVSICTTTWFISRNKSGKLADILRINSSSNGLIVFRK